jgi:hypothetical protein
MSALKGLRSSTTPPRMRGTEARQHQTGGDPVNGRVGDRLILEGTHVGDHKRIGVITELRHDDGTPPYMVHWLDNGHDSLVYPGSDAHIETGAAGRDGSSAIL